MKVKILFLISSVFLSFSSYCQSKEALAKEINDMANSCIISQHNFKIDAYGNVTLGFREVLKSKFNLNDLDSMQLVSDSTYTGIAFLCKSCFTDNNDVKDNKTEKKFLILTSAAMTKKIILKLKELQKLNQ